VCTKVQGTGIRVKKVILKGVLRLSIQPVQLGGGGGSRARAARAKKTHQQPSNTITRITPRAPGGPVITTEASNEVAQVLHPAWQRHPVQLVRYMPVSEITAKTRPPRSLLLVAAAAVAGAATPHQRVDYFGQEIKATRWQDGRLYATQSPPCVFCIMQISLSEYTQGRMQM
jgi:hypothetical protein